MKDAIQAVIDAISSVIGAIGRIHFPSKPSWIPLTAPGGYSMPSAFLSPAGLAAEGTAGWSSTSAYRERSTPNPRLSKSGGSWNATTAAAAGDRWAANRERPDTTGYALAVVINGTEIDPALVIADVTIRSGRTRQDDGIEPATTTIELIETTPTGLAIGIAQVIVVTVDAAPRFTGRITEITRTPIAGEQGTTWTIVGTGQLSRLGRFLLTLRSPPKPRRPGPSG